VRAAAEDAFGAGWSDAECLLETKMIGGRPSRNSLSRYRLKGVRTAQGLRARVT